jgi:hypothetical protein
MVSGFLDSAIKILSLGAVGLGFLLAFLAYNLLRSEITKETAETDQKRLDAIKSFQNFTLFILLIGALSQIAPVIIQKVSIPPTGLSENPGQVPQDPTQLQTGQIYVQAKSIKRDEINEGIIFLNLLLQNGYIAAIYKSKNEYLAISILARSELEADVIIQQLRDKNIALDAYRTDGKNYVLYTKLF